MGSSPISAPMDNFNMTDAVRHRPVAGPEIQGPKPVSMGSCLVSVGARRGWESGASRLWIGCSTCSLASRFYILESSANGVRRLGIKYVYGTLDEKHGDSQLVEALSAGLCWNCKKKGRLGPDGG